MTQAKETDLGPLTWVKGEIDAALQRTAAALAEAADKVIRLKNGKIRDITVNAQPKAVSEVAW